jgi:hypothetical protein
LTARDRVGLDEAFPAAGLPLGLARLVVEAAALMKAPSARTAVALRSWFAKRSSGDVRTVAALDRRPGPALDRARPAGPAAGRTARRAAELSGIGAASGRSLTAAAVAA